MAMANSYAQNATQIRFGDRILEEEPNPVALKQKLPIEEKSIQFLDAQVSGKTFEYQTAQTSARRMTNITVPRIQKFSVPTRTSVAVNQSTTAQQVSSSKNLSVPKLPTLAPIKKTYSVNEFQKEQKPQQFSRNLQVPLIRSNYQSGVPREAFEQASTQQGQQQQGQQKSTAEKNKAYASLFQMISELFSGNQQQQQKGVSLSNLIQKQNVDNKTLLAEIQNTENQLIAESAKINPQDRVLKIWNDLRLEEIQYIKKKVQESVQNSPLVYNKPILTAADVIQRTKANDQKIQELQTVIMQEQQKITQNDKERDQLLTAILNSSKEEEDNILTQKINAVNELNRIAIKNKNDAEATIAQLKFDNVNMQVQLTNVKTEIQTNTVNQSEKLVLDTYKEAAQQARQKSIKKLQVRFQEVDKVKSEDSILESSAIQKVAEVLKSGSEFQSDAAIKEIISVLNKSERDFAQMRQEFGEKLQKLNQLATNVKNKNGNQIQANNQRIAELEKQIQAKDARIKELESKKVDQAQSDAFENLRKENAELKETVKNLTRINDFRAMRIEVKEDEIKKLKGELVMKNAQVAAIVPEEKKKLEEKIDALISEQNSLRTTINEREKQIVTLQETITKQNADLAKNVNNASSTFELQVLKKEVESLKQTKSTLELANQNLSNQVNSLTTQVNDLKQKNIELNKEITNLTATNTATAQKYETTLKNYQLRVQQSIQKFLPTGTTIVLSSNEADTDKAISAALSKLVEPYKSKVQTLTQQLSAKQAEIDGLINQDANVSALTTKIAEQQRIIADMQTQLDEANKASGQANQELLKTQNELKAFKEEVNAVVTQLQVEIGLEKPTSVLENLFSMINPQADTTKKQVTLKELVPALKNYADNLKNVAADAAKAQQKAENAQKAANEATIQAKQAQQSATAARNNAKQDSKNAKTDVDDANKAKAAAEEELAKAKARIRDLQDKNKQIQAQLEATKKKVTDPIPKGQQLQQQMDTIANNPLINPLANPLANPFTNPLANPLANSEAQSYDSKVAQSAVRLLGDIGIELKKDQNGKLLLQDNHLVVDNLENYRNLNSKYSFRDAKEKLIALGVVSNTASNIAPTSVQAMSQDQYDKFIKIWLQEVFDYWSMEDRFIQDNHVEGMKYLSLNDEELRNRNRFVERMKYLNQVLKSPNELNKILLNYQKAKPGVSPVKMTGIEYNIKVQEEKLGEKVTDNLRNLQSSDPILQQLNAMYTFYYDENGGEIKYGPKNANNTTSQIALISPIDLMKNYFLKGKFNQSNGFSRKLNK